jgi:4-amino-4-deoxy-L-arabinose transferase-like glycosyltransferase
MPPSTVATFPLEQTPRSDAAPASRAMPLVREWLIVLILAFAYAAIRIALIPPGAEFTRGFSHDSGYLASVASNVLTGKGYVNDALWYVFMMPASLPMPFHNANPLYPTATMAVAFVTNLDVFRAGFIVSALSSVILFVAVASLVRPHLPTVWHAAGVALLVVVFPPVLADSFRYLSDSLCASLLVAFFAIVVRTASPIGWIAAGVVLGLAWLTRGAVVSIAPALVVYPFLRFRPSQAAVRLAVLSAGGLIVISPWLIHTKTVWGSYLRSDAGYSIVQDFATEKYGSVVKYRHAVEPPPTLTDFVKQAPAAAAKRVVVGTVKVARRGLAWWSLHNVVIAMVMSTGVLVWILNRRRLLSPEGIGLTLFAGTSLFMLAILGDSFEERYALTFTVLYALFSILGWWRIAQHQRGRGRFIVAGVFALVWLVLVPFYAVREYRYWYTPDAALVSYRAAAAEVNSRFAKGTPVIVGLAPYFYSVETFASGISFPDADDDFLFRFMDRYGARFIYLTDEELDLWRPQWRSPSHLPSELRLAGTVGNGLVFARRDTP